MKSTRMFLLLVLAAVLAVSALPAIADEIDESLLVEHMVRAMVRQGVPEEGALRLARQSRFMAEMAAGTLEREQRRLQGCDCEPVGDQVPDRTREHAQDCALAGTGDELRLSVQARVGTAFGRTLGAALNHYGEEACAPAAMALFSATRRGLSPEVGATAVESFAENGYPLEQMYRFQMWMAERVGAGAQADEEVLCDQIRQMTRTRTRLATMTQQMEAVCAEASQGGSSDGQGSGQSGNASSGGGGESAGGEHGGGDSHGGGESGSNSGGQGQGY